MRLSVLVSGPDAARLASALREASDQLDVVEASTEAAARAYLSGTVFARVFDTHADGAVAALAADLNVPSDTVSGDVDAGGLLRRLGIAAPATPIGSAAPAGLPAVSDQLLALGEAISELAHRLNNPMAVIQGNAQLALELGRSTALDPMLTESLVDIENASRQLATGFRELAALRGAVDAARAELGGQ